MKSVRIVHSSAQAVSCQFRHRWMFDWYLCGHTVYLFGVDMPETIDKRLTEAATALLCDRVTGCLKFG